MEFIFVINFIHIKFNNHFDRIKDTEIFLIYWIILEMLVSLNSKAQNTLSKEFNIPNTLLITCLTIYQC